MAVISMVEDFPTVNRRVPIGQAVTIQVFTVAFPLFALLADQPTLFFYSLCRWIWRYSSPFLPRKPIAAGCPAIQGNRSRSHDAVIRVYDAAGNVIEMEEHKGDFKEWVKYLLASHFSLFSMPVEKLTAC